jgi:hypothetical protein
MTINNCVFPFKQTDFSTLIGNSLQANYIYQYLTALNAKTFVVEDDYIDKNYLIDYQKFYSRSFEEIKRFTKRIHFFSGQFSIRELERTLDDNNIQDFGKYLGFVVVRPIKDPNGNPLIGRTLVQTYPPSTNGKKRFYVTADYDASLFGIDLSIKSIPFQTQDQGVSACATIALWTSLQSLIPVFGIPERSPAEITEMAMEFPSQSRIFPQTGLTLGQILTCIRSMDLDVEVIKAADNDVIATAIKAYTYAGIPLIGTLKLSKESSVDYHAVVIDGYQYDNDGTLTELYVHDDQIGPYSRVEPNPDFINWKNKWSTDLGYQVELGEVLVPIYHKIRLPFHHIYQHYASKKDYIARYDVTLDLYLTTVQKYKNSLISKRIDGKSKLLQMSLPRFIWIERACEKGKRDPIHDDVFDGTAIRCTKCASVDYE